VTLRYVIPSEDEPAGRLWPAGTRNWHLVALICLLKVGTVLLLVATALVRLFKWIVFKEVPHARI